MRCSLCREASWKPPLLREMITSRLLPRIAIVVPVYNEADSVLKTLSALACYRAKGHRIIVVDGGSTDSTPELSAPFADGVIRSSKGRAFQQNAGAKLAEADVLLFLHADTALPDHADKLLVEALSGGKVWGRFDVSIAGRPWGLKLISALMNIRSRLTGIATGDQAIFVRKSVFEQLGGFPEIPLMEDIELSKRLKRFGRPVCIRNKVITSGRRWETDGLCKTVLLMWKLRLLYFLGVSPDRLAKLYRDTRDARG